MKAPYLGNGGIQLPGKVLQRLPLVLPVVYAGGGQTIFNPCFQLVKGIFLLGEVNLSAGDEYLGPCLQGIIKIRELLLQGICCLLPVYGVVFKIVVYSA